MSKGKNSKRSDKKAPLRTMKEKKAAKDLKKNEKKHPGLPNELK